MVPFLGSLLLFNQHVVDFLTLSPKLIGRWLHLSAADSSEAARKVTLTRLYYVYFGLSLLGMGSALFSLFCPLSIKNYASPIDYINGEASLLSSARIKIMLPDITYQYSYWLGDLVNQVPGLLVRWGQPLDFFNLFTIVFNDAYLTMPAEEHVEQEELDPEGNLDRNHPYEDFRGRPDAAKIAHTFHSGARIQEGFVHEIEKILSGTAFRNDVMTLQYMADDHSKPATRIIVFCFYVSGFALLFVPTALTFGSLLKHIFF